MNRIYRVTVWSEEAVTIELEAENKDMAEQSAMSLVRLESFDKAITYKYIHGEMNIQDVELVQ